MAAPTYTHKTPPTSGAGEGEQDNLGGQVMDANRVAIQGLGSGFITTDVSGTPITSPATVSTSAVTTITIPANAIRMFITNTMTVNTDLLYVSELSGVTTYDIINAGATREYDCGRMGNLYLKANGANVTASFAFQLVD
jgi:hypothetical protein